MYLSSINLDSQISHSDTTNVLIARNKKIIFDKNSGV